MKGNHYSIAFRLIKAGANVNEIEGNGKSILWNCCQRNTPSFVDALFRAGAKIDENEVDESGDSLLWSICRKGYSRCVLLLIDAGANVNVQKIDKDRRTLLLHASRFDWVWLVQKLIELGSDVNAVDKYGLTPLWMAGLSGHLDVALALIEAGAYVDTQHIDTDGRSLLWYACSFETKHMAKELTEELNYRTSNLTEQSGEIPCWIATRERNANLVKRLIRAGADVNVVDRYGWSPLWIACQNDLTHLMRRYAKSRCWDHVEVPKTGVTGIISLMDKCCRDMDGLPRQLINAGANVNICDKNSQSLLHDCCKKDLTDIVLLLLESGANPFLKDKEDRVVFDCFSTSRRKFDIFARKAYIYHRVHFGLLLSYKPTEERNPNIFWRLKNKNYDCWRFTFGFL